MPNQQGEYSDNFLRAVEVIIQLETGGDALGGYTNDPRDPGGETRWGIAKRFNPSLDIKNLTKPQAIACYHDRYWNALRCDELAWPICLIVFDCAVNPGQSFAATNLQKVSGVHADGRIGPVTIAAANRLDPILLADRMSQARLKYWATRDGWSVYRNGWIDRAFTVFRKAFL